MAVFKDLQAIAQNIAACLMPCCVPQYPIYSQFNNFFDNHFVNSLIYLIPGHYISSHFPKSS